MFVFLLAPSRPLSQSDEAKGTGSNEINKIDSIDLCSFMLAFLEIATKDISRQLNWAAARAN